MLKGNLFLQKERDHYKTKILSAKSDLEKFDEIINSKVSKAVYLKNQEIDKLKGIVET